VYPIADIELAVVWRWCKTEILSSTWGMKDRIAHNEHSRPAYLTRLTILLTKLSKQLVRCGVVGCGRADLTGGAAVAE
jgi:hypothetical protein